MFKNIILIPYRNRKSHLKYFLEHTVPIIQEFMPNTKVIVIEQCEGKLFNRGKILNVGLHEFLLRFIRDLYSVNSNLQNNYFFGKE